MKTLLISILLICLIFPSLIYSSPTQDIYWPVFNSWMDAYEVKYHSSEINEKFESFKMNCIQVQKSNSDNIKFVTVTYDKENNVENSFIESSFGRKLQSINDIEAQPSMLITLPRSNIPTQSLNQYSDLSYGEFIDMYTGQNGGVESITQTNFQSLSDGVISSIAIGSFIFCIALVGGTIYLIKRNSKTKGQKETQEQKEIKEVEDHIKKVFGGVNVFDLKPGSHQSITARGCPIEMLDININDDDDNKNNNNKNTNS
ncbi:hypothetical protein RB653_002596 [Dictyostelium firmibasis]|uniref:Cathepsin propeptide inhibitor domain-containing protein n=1 Tax=Dictyostelium firmibasis TaxID=79012 RepID=A0AAN7U9K8_9MYCE